MLSGIWGYGPRIRLTSYWARWRLKSPASSLFTQPFIRAQIKENIKAPRHWPLCEEFTGDRSPVNSPQKWPLTRKMFLFDDGVNVIISLKTHFLTNISEKCSIKKSSLFHSNVKSLPKHYYELESWINSLNFTLFIHCFDWKFVGWVKTRPFWPASLQLFT